MTRGFGLKATNGVSISGLSNLKPTRTQNINSRRSAAQLPWSRASISTDTQRPALAGAIVRRRMWRGRYFSTSGQNMAVVKVPRSLLKRLTDAVCYAA
jgi:hypothetical protein